MAAVIGAGFRIDDLDAAGVDVQLAPDRILTLLLDADAEFGEVLQAAVKRPALDDEADQRRPKDEDQGDIKI